MCTPEEQIRGLDAYADGSAHDCLFILMTPTSHLSAPMDALVTHTYGL
jgi:hypothetical protein